MYQCRIVGLQRTTIPLSQQMSLPWHGKLQYDHYTKEKGLAENSIQKLLVQLAHNAVSMGFKRKDVFEGRQHVLPASYTHEEKLRKIGRILGIMAKEGLIGKPGKKWNITEKGESELRD